MKFNYTPEDCAKAREYLEKHNLDYLISRLTDGWTIVSIANYHILHGNHYAEKPNK